MPAEPTDPTSAAPGCPLTTALATIGGKWAMICLYWLTDGTRRFGELQRLMPEISHKVLAETLRQLEHEGLITRTVRSEMPAHVEYALSSYGESVKPIIDMMRTWGRAHLSHTERPSASIEQKSPVLHSFLKSREGAKRSASRPRPMHASQSEADCHRHPIHGDGETSDQEHAPDRNL